MRKDLQQKIDEYLYFENLKYNLVGEKALFFSDKVRDKAFNGYKYFIRNEFYEVCVFENEEKLERFLDEQKERRTK
jgi:hypothetical protein